MIQFIFVALLVAVDFITKRIAVSNLLGKGRIPIINGFFNFTYVENTGAAFGSLQGARWFFVGITVAMLALCVWYYLKLQKEENSFLAKVGVLLVISGAIGNLIDRLTKGYVVDMLDFIIFGYDFPVFNFADICVCVGAFLYLLWGFASEIRKKK